MPGMLIYYYYKKITPPMTGCKVYFNDQRDARTDSHADQTD